MRFDCNEIGDIMSEIAAYGMAVQSNPCSQPTPTKADSSPPFQLSAPYLPITDG
jgi:hypothetical protein